MIERASDDNEYTIRNEAKRNEKKIHKLSDSWEAASQEKERTAVRPSDGCKY